MEIVKIVVSTLTVFAAAFLGSRIALKKYRKEKLWEAKHKAYTDVLSAIFAINYWAEEHYSNTVPCLPSSSKEKLDDLYKEFENSRQQLWKTVKIGELVISKNTIELLEAFLTSLEKERFRYIDEYTDGGMHDQEFRDHLDEIRKIVGTNLPDVIKLSKSDLAKL